MAIKSLRKNMTVSSSISRDLAKMGYEYTETECSTCEEGNLWVNTYELVCENCAQVIRKGEKSRVHNKHPVVYFRENRDEFEYDNSGRARLIGGFEFAYYGDGIYGDDKDEEDESGSG